ncbi:MAG: signal peptidase I [Phycisphaerales bacterium]|nr:signal peptidase I [Phycisphaerales bacterium]
MTITSPAANRPRSPNVAALLSFLTMGLGHIYCGRFGKGLVLLFLGMFSGAFAPLVILPVTSTLRIPVVILLHLHTILWIYAIIDARYVARAIGNTYTLRDYNRWYIYLLLTLLILPISVASALEVRAHAVEAFYITSTCMAPAIHQGDHVLVDKLAYQNGPVLRGDVVVFHNPNNRSQANIKRVIALPGDTVEISSGRILVNNAPPSSLASTTTRPADLPRLTVPPGHCFALGDNPNLSEDSHVSEDSRTYGPIPLADLIGRVTYIYYPRLQKIN